MKKNKQGREFTEIMDVMTPMEKFWVFSTAAMFLTRKGGKLINLTFLSFPIFLRLFREMLKELGMKNAKQLLKDWEWMIYASFLTIISLKNFGKPKTRNQEENSELEMLKNLIAKCEEMGNECGNKFEFDDEIIYDDASGTGLLFDENLNGNRNRNRNYSL